MATPVIITGFEHGINPSTNGGGLADNIVGTPVVQGTVKYSGDYALQIETTSDALESIRMPLSQVAMTVVSFRVRFETFPNYATEVLTIGNNIGSATYGKVWFDPADNKLEFRFGTTAGNKYGTALSIGVWYKIDIKYDLGNATLTLDAKVDGNDITQVTYSSYASTNFSVRFGWYSVAVTGNMYIDDVVASETGADYPLGNVIVKAPRPNAEGTHNAGTNVIEDSAGNDIDGSTYQAYPKLDDKPWGSTVEDYIRQAAVGSGNYAEVEFEDLTDIDTVIGVQALLQYAASGSTNSSASTYIRDGSTDRTVYSGDMSETSAFYKRAIIQPASSWSQSVINALKGRIGYATDVGSMPYWMGLILEVAYIPSTSSPQTITLSTGTLVAAGIPLTVNAPEPDKAYVSWAELIVPASPSIIISLSTGQLTASGQSLSVLPGEVTIPLNTGLLTANGVTLTPVPGPVTVSLSTGLLVAGGITLTPTPGPVTIVLDTGLLTAGGVTLTPIPGPVSVILSTGGLTASGITLTVQNIQDDVAYVSWSYLMTPLTPGIYISLQTGQLNVSGQALSVIPGAVQIALSTGQLTANGIQLTVSVGGAAPQTIVLNTGQLTASGVSLNVIPGEVIIHLDTGSLLASGVNLADVVAGAVIIALNTGQLTATGIALADVVGGEVIILLDTGTLVASGIKLTVSAGAAIPQTIVLQTGQLTASGISASIIPGAVTLNLSTGELTANGQSLTLLPGEVSILLQTGQLLASGISLEDIIAILPEAGAGLRKVYGFIGRGTYSASRRQIYSEDDEITLPPRDVPRQEDD